VTDWATGLERRLALVTPADTTRGMFFNGVLALVRQQGSAEGVKRCLAACDNQRFLDFFNYPAEQFLKLVWAAARVLEPGLEGFEPALRVLGRQAATDFLSSAAGKALMLLGQGDVRRLMENLPSAYRVSVSYGQRTVEWTGPQSGRLLMERDFMPFAYHEGVLVGLLEAQGVTGVKVVGHQEGLMSSEYDFSWE
jgi:uncharacterized protein (TIGR02265 family)